MKNKKRLDYTLVAEGFAEYAFIPTYLRIVAEQYNVQAVPSKLDLKKKQPSKSKVLQEAGKLCIAAMQANHDLFIAGIDLDKPDHEKTQPVHELECTILSTAIGKTYKAHSNKIVIYVPVQAIEHWLAYQAHKLDTKPTFPTFADNGVESKSQDELKQLLYKGNDNGDFMERTAKAIAEKADFAQLAKQSRSFGHFHKQVTEFLTTFINQTI
ncbi:MAG: DUF4276 family protein [Rudanella sp.]|nr:DUF4276 family protein [Rudanella sp.]